MSINDDLLAKMKSQYGGYVQGGAGVDPFQSLNSASGFVSSLANGAGAGSGFTADQTRQANYDYRMGAQQAGVQGKGDPNDFAPYDPNAKPSAPFDPFAGQNKNDPNVQMQMIQYSQSHDGYAKANGLNIPAPSYGGVGSSLYGGDSNFGTNSAQLAFAQMHGANAQQMNGIQSRQAIGGDGPNMNPENPQYPQGVQQSPYGQPQNNMSADQQRHAPQVYHAPQGNYGQQQQYQQPQGYQQPSNYGQAPAYGGQQSNPYAPQQPAQQSQNGLLSTSQGGRNRYGLLSY